MAVEFALLDDGARVTDYLILSASRGICDTLTQNAAESVHRGRATMACLSSGDGR
jgi:hypothetical protein